MREIKFRAWDRIVDNMYYFDLYELGGFTDRKISLPPEDYIMQYIGLKDKNLKEIYEGDILRHGDWMNPSKNTEVKDTIVVWNNKEGKYDGVYPTLYPRRMSEIIGNIYENPDLLNKQTMTKTYKHKRLGWIAKEQSEGYIIDKDDSLFHKELIENSLDREEIKQEDWINSMHKDKSLGTFDNINCIRGAIEKYMPKVTMQEIDSLWMTDKDMKGFLLKRSDVIELLKSKGLLKDK